MKYPQGEHENIDLTIDGSAKSMTMNALAATTAAPSSHLTMPYLSDKRIQRVRQQSHGTPATIRTHRNIIPKCSINFAFESVCFGSIASVRLLALGSD